MISVAMGMGSALAALLLLAVPGADAGPTSVDAGPEPLVIETGPPMDAKPAPEKPLMVSGDPSVVEVRHLHMIIDRHGDRLNVSQVFTLGTPEGIRYRSDAGFTIPLPVGAIAPRKGDPEHEDLAARITEKGFRVVDPLFPGGNDITVHFDLPIEEGHASLEQRLPVKVAVGQVVLTYTAGDTTLAVHGYEKARRIELQNGLTALVAMGRNPGKRVSVLVRGLPSSADEMWRVVVLVVSVLLLAIGVIGWFVSRRGRGSGVGEDVKAGGD